jgi:hypothetical protein
MVKRKKPAIPQGVQKNAPPLGIWELDRFTSASLDRWNNLSKDLDDLENTLFFNLEPDRRRFRPELIAALKQTEAISLEIQGWVRIVPWRYTLSPLSSAGSLTGDGGRFNIGADIDAIPFQPWPALYLAEDHETAYREKFQLKSTEITDGLKPNELALEPGDSYSSVRLNGLVSGVFDMTEPQHLNAVAGVLKKIKMPERAKGLMKKLRITSRQLYMIQTGQRLYDAVAIQNWRIKPVQFGIASQSQILAELIRTAGFEAIVYKSTQGTKRCLAVFPDKISGNTYIEVSDPCPSEITYTRLDTDTADVLSGL